MELARGGRLRFWPGSFLTVASLGCLAHQALAASGDLRLSKIALYIENYQTTLACLRPAGIVCDDNPFTPSNISVNGNIFTDYNVYFIALDVNTSAGISSVSMTLEHDPEIAVYAWRQCADQQTFSDEWPASGSGITLSYDSCSGTTPDPNDPEGDGSVVLGGMWVYAYDSGTLRIGDSAHTQRAVLTNCQGDTTQIAWQSPGWLRALGEVGFGEQPILPVCEDVGSSDPNCEVGLNWMFVCCMPDSTCGNDVAQVSERACQFAGGLWRIVPCRQSCGGNLCGTVPVTPLTWGRLKNKY